MCSGAPDFGNITLQSANPSDPKDILGTENSVQLMTQKPVTTTYPWSGGKTRNTMKLERSFIETEDDGSFNWDFNGQTQVIVVNQNETNKYGEYRGYRSMCDGIIHPFPGFRWWLEAHILTQQQSCRTRA